MTSNKRSDILLESGTNELEILVFTLDNQRFGVNVAKVREVIEPLNVNHLPHAHPAVLGVFQLRHTVTPLIDLRKALKKSGSDPAEGKIVIMEFNDARVGFLVESVEQIYRVGWKAVAAMPDLEGVREAPLTSIAHIGDHMVLMLDFEKIMFDIGGVDLFEQAAQRLTHGTGRGDHRVMLAEDSNLMRQLITTNLVKAGYDNLVVCHDGEEAWEQLQKGVALDGEPPVDLLITDIEMPKMDGLYLTRCVKEHEKLKKIPVIVFSSLVSEDNQKKCDAVGADAQITKPQLDELVNLLDRLLQEAKTGKSSGALASV